MQLKSDYFRIEIELNIAYLENVMTVKIRLF